MASATSPRELAAIARDYRRGQGQTPPRMVAGDEAVGDAGWDRDELPYDPARIDYVPGQARPLEVNGGPAIALSNAFGFGGHNVVLCLEV